jgi:hypothetical protein
MRRCLFPRSEFDSQGCEADDLLEPKGFQKGGRAWRAGSLSPKPLHRQSKLAKHGFSFENCWDCVKAGPMLNTDSTCQPGCGYPAIFPLTQRRVGLHESLFSGAKQVRTRASVTDGCPHGVEKAILIGGDRYPSRQAIHPAIRAGIPAFSCQDRSSLPPMLEKRTP